MDWQEYVKSLSKEDQEKMLLSILEHMFELGCDSEVGFTDGEDGEITIYWSNTGENLI